MVFLAVTNSKNRGPGNTAGILRSHLEGVTLLCLGFYSLYCELMQHEGGTNKASVGARMAQRKGSLRLGVGGAVRHSFSGRFV